MENKASDQQESPDPQMVKKDPGEEEPSKEQEGSDDPDLDSPIKVRIKTMDEQEKQIEVKLSDKVSDLKQKIVAEMEIPIERQRLIFLGKQLKDAQTLHECKIKNDVCILLVANRVQNRSEAPRRENQNAEERNNNDVDLPAFIFNALNETAQMRRNRRLLFQQNARSFLRNLRLNVNQSRETIVQNLASTQLLLDSRRPLEEVKTGQPNVETAVECFDFEKRELKVGQWVDVKDTINQWLEAQVVEIRDNRAYIHYNGWGTRWDEWIEINSPRIAVFRTHTIQSATSAYLSPHPNSAPDSQESVSLSSSSNNNLDNLSKMIELNSQTIHFMRKLKKLKEQYEVQIKIQRERVEEQSKKQWDKYKEKDPVSEEEEKQPLLSGSKTFNAREEMKQEIGKEEEDFMKKDLQGMINENAILYQKIIMLSGQLAPIMDRMGRVFTDFSPHLLHNVNTFNNNVSNGSSNPNRVRRHRTHNHRDRRNRNEEDDDIESELSSDSLSRRSGDGSEHSENNEGNNGGEIRTRLRSISNTISRIRNSISSMRSLIFNNLGREGQEANQENHRIDERGENRITVNAQVPIISSPGDIASVHNIFDRFVDRQMVNVINGGEGRNRNRNEQNSSNNESSNNSSNTNTDRINSASNNRSNSRENPNNQRPRAGNRNPGPNRNLDEMNPFLGLTDHDPGLGLLGGALGGLSGLNAGSETIELHIHAFMPNQRDGQEGPRARNQPQNENNDRNAQVRQILNPIREIIQDRRERSSESRDSHDSSEDRRPRFADVGIQTEKRSRRRRDDRNRDRMDSECSMSSSSMHHVSSSQNMQTETPLESLMVKEEGPSQSDFICMTEQNPTFEQEVQATSKTCDAEIQTASVSMTPNPPPLTLDQLNRLGDEPEPILEQKKAKPTLKRGTSNRVKKKRSIIPKSSIKRAEPSGSPAMVFSPGDKKVSTKLNAPQMKKSNTMSSTMPRNALGQGSNRFLFRGNEEFHNTMGRHSDARAHMNSNPGGYVGTKRSKNSSQK